MSADIQVRHSIVEDVRGILENIIDNALDIALHTVEVRTFNELLLDSIKQEFLREHIELWMRPVILFIHIENHLGNLEGETFREQYESFFCRWRQGLVQTRMAKQFPQLELITQKRVSRRLSHYATVLQRWEKDRDALRSTRIKVPTEVVTIYSTGDPHNGGLSTCVLGGTDGQKLVYKPRSDASEKLMSSILELLDVEPSTFLPETFGQQDYLWQEFVESADISDANENAQYYRLGELQALCYFTGTSDMHVENVIFTREGPVMLDLECLAAPRTRLDSDLDLSINHHLDTPAMTGILPMPVGGDAKRPASNWGAFCGSPNIQSMETGFEIRNDGQSNITFLKTSKTTTYDTDPQRRMTAANVRNDFLIGWTSMSGRIRKKSHEILTLLRNSTLASRIVLSPTQLYGEILSRLNHPSNLRGDNVRRNGAIRYLTNSGGYTANVLLEMEVEDLLQGDVPIHFVEVGADELLLSSSSGSMSIPLHSGILIVKGRLKALESDADCARLYRYTDRAIQGYTLGSITTAQKSATPELTTSESLEGTEVSATGDKSTTNHEELIIRVLENSIADAWPTNGSPVWFNLNINPNDQWGVDRSGFDFYNGIPGSMLGVLSLSSALGYNGGIEFGERLYTELLRIAEEKFSALDDPGLFTGVGGIAYSLAATAKFVHLPVSRINETVSRLLERAAALLDRQESADLIAGAAGVAMLSSRLYESGFVRKTTHIAAVNEAIERLEALSVSVGRTGRNLGGYRAWISQGGQWLGGLSHGVAGVALSLSVASDTVPAARKLAQQAWDTQDAIYDQCRQRWEDRRDQDLLTPGVHQDSWCHGGEGIVLAYQQARARGIKSGIPHSEYMRVFSSLEPPVGPSLCHGAAGRLLSNITFLRLEGNRRIDAIERNIEAARISTMISLESSGSAVTGADSFRFSDSLMLGRLGGAYALGVEQCPDIVPNLFQHSIDRA